jgi:hypothetical protein
VTTTTKRLEEISFFVPPFLYLRLRSKSLIFTRLRSGRFRVYYVQIESTPDAHAQKEYAAFVVLELNDLDPFF